MDVPINKALDPAEIDWARIRREFPVTERLAYLNSAAAGPLSSSVSAAGSRYYELMSRDGDEHWDAWLVERERLRAKLAAFINAEPDEVAFTTNTSSGMNVIVDALEGAGDVISCDLEFPVSTITWLHRGFHLSFVDSKNGVVDVEMIRRAMTPRTGIISLSHVQFSNGLRCDLESIGELKGNHALVVNASQSAGVFEINVKRMKIDALASTGHKWMLSGYGSGFVYISRELQNRTRPRSIGWMSVEEPYAMRNREVNLRNDLAARVELGCPHFAGIFAIGTAIEQARSIGMKEIERRALDLNRALTSRLSVAGWEVLSPLAREGMRSAETLVRVEKPAHVVAELMARGVAVTEKPQGIRVSTHFFNNPDDIERLIAALDEIRS